MGPRPAREEPRSITVVPPSGMFGGVVVVHTKHAAKPSDSAMLSPRNRIQTNSRPSSFARVYQQKQFVALADSIREHNRHPKFDGENAFTEYQPAALARFCASGW